MEVKIDMGGLDTGLARLTQGNGFKRGLAAAALELAGELKKYPPVRRGPQPFKTRKQQRAFFAMLKSGEITVPYVRGSAKGSQKLGQSWTTRASAGGLVQSVGTNVSYARFVVGEKQSMYHKVTGWKTAEQVAKAMETRILSIVAAEVGRDI